MQSELGDRVGKDDWPRAVVMPAAKEESAEGKRCTSLIVSAIVLGIIMLRKGFSASQMQCWKYLSLVELRKDPGKVKCCSIKKV